MANLLITYTALLGAQGAILSLRRRSVLHAAEIMLSEAAKWEYATVEDDPTAPIVLEYCLNFYKALKRML